MSRLLIKRSDGGVSILQDGDVPNRERALAGWIETARPEWLPIVSTREITVDDLPKDREFRNAWCDVTKEATVDIDLVKAKEIQLVKLRRERDKLLLETDQDHLVALIRKDEAAVDSSTTRAQLLRDSTEPLKELSVSGYNDESVLQQIRELGKLDIDTP